MPAWWRLAPRRCTPGRGWVRVGARGAACGSAGRGRRGRVGGCGRAPHRAMAAVAVAGGAHQRVVVGDVARRRWSQPWGSAFEEGDESAPRTHWFETMQCMPAAIAPPPVHRLVLCIELLKAGLRLLWLRRAATAAATAAKTPPAAPDVRCWPPAIRQAWTRARQERRALLRTLQQLRADAHKRFGIGTGVSVVRRRAPHSRAGPRGAAATVANARLHERHRTALATLRPRSAHSAPGAVSAVRAARAILVQLAGFAHGGWHRMARASAFGGGGLLDGRRPADRRARAAAAVSTIALAVVRAASAGVRVAGGAASGEVCAASPLDSRSRSVGHGGAARQRALLLLHRRFLK
eukprot:ctg_1224.g424